MPILDTARGLRLVQQGGSPYFSLHTGLPATVANELPTAGGYARQRSTSGLSAGQWRQQPDGARRVFFPNQRVDFPRATARIAGIRCVGISYSGVRGDVTETIFAWTPQLVGAPIALDVGDQFSIDPNSLYMETSDDGNIGHEGVLSAFFSQGAWRGYYMSLHTASPSTLANELTGRGYARVPLSNLNIPRLPDRDVESSTVSVTGPSVVITFPDVTAAWETPTHYVIWSDQQGRRRIAEGAFMPAAPASPENGRYVIPVNAMSFTFDVA